MASLKHHQVDLFTFDQVTEAEHVNSNAVYQNRMEENLITTSLI